MPPTRPVLEPDHAMHHTSTSPTLAELRARIDAIDTTLFDLIQQRAAIAPLVIQAKGGGPIWRPAREAQIFRKLRDKIRTSQAKDFDNKTVASNKDHTAAPPFPPLSLLEIWARLMTGMTSIEEDFNFALVVPPKLPKPDQTASHVSTHPQAGGAQIDQALAHDYLRTIRTHFGALPQVTLYDKAETALAQASRHAILMMPWPEEQQTASDSNPLASPLIYSDAPLKSASAPHYATAANATPNSQIDYDWWRLLLKPEYKSFVIGMKLPFLPHRETMRPLALLAKIQLEPSGDDCTLAVEQDPDNPNHKKLFALNGYRDAQHPDIVKRHAQIIGVYPRPMPPL